MILALTLCLSSCGQKSVENVNETSTSIVSSEAKEISSKNDKTSEEVTAIVESTKDEVSEEVVEEAKDKENPNGENEKESEDEASEDVPQKEVREIKAPSNSGRLHVDGIDIKNENGEKVQLKGLSTHGLAWYPSYVNNDLFHEFRNEWNCNVIRLAMYTEEYGGYVSGGNRKELKELIDSGVRLARDNDMYAIIDWHILSDGNPNKNKDAAKEFFKEVSDNYKYYNNVIYEICNEPNGGTKWKDIKAYAEEVIPVIRENDESAIILVGTPNWSQFVDEAAKDPIEGYDNIMYTLHFYADTHKDDLRKTMTKALKDGLPIFVSEYGICDASGNGAINEKEAQKWMDLMDKYNISSCAWNISNKGETSAIFGSWTDKTHGFKSDDLSPSGKWVYSMLTGNSMIESSSDKDEPDDKEEFKEDTEAVKIVEGDLVFYLKEVNSWGSEEGTCHQFELTVVNNGSDVSNWSVDISFDSDITLKDGWCGIYSEKGKVLSVSNESYNGQIKKGGATKDIGFIIVY